MADALVLGASTDGVWVQVPSPAPNQYNPNQIFLIGDGFGLFVLAIKDNPRLCRGEKIAYGEGQSRQEKVSELE